MPLFSKCLNKPVDKQKDTAEDKKSRDRYETLINRLTLRASVMETVKHMNTTDEGMNPGKCWGYIRRDVLSRASCVYSESPIQKYREAALWLIEKVREDSRFSRALQIRGKGTTKQPVFSEASVWNFINTYVVKDQLKKVAVKKNPTMQ